MCERCRAYKDSSDLISCSFQQSRPFRSRLVSQVICHFRLLPVFSLIPFFFFFFATQWLWTLNSLFSFHLHHLFNFPLTLSRFPHADVNMLDLRGFSPSKALWRFYQSLILSAPKLVNFSGHLFTRAQIFFQILMISPQLVTFSCEKQFHQAKSKICLFS